MASVFEVEERPKWQSDRREALVDVLLSPKPETLLKIMVALCGVWAVFVAWAAIALVQLLLS